MAYSLGIDSSTQSCSAIIIDPESGSIIAEASVNFGQQLPHYSAPSGFIPDRPNGEVHSDPGMWLDALEMLLEDLGEKCDLAKVEAISGAAQQHGSVYLKQSWFETLKNLKSDQSLSSQLLPCLSRVTSPIWMDTSTTQECKEISDTIGSNEKVCEKSGSIATERFAGPQIRRFYKQDPSAYVETARIHLISSFLCSIFCGSDTAIDTGDGSGMNLLNISTWQWDQDLLEATAPRLDDKLPPVVAGATKVGTVSRYFQEKFGFATDISVTVFTGDNPSSLVGMGASQPEKVIISLGTSDTLFAAMPQVVADPEGCGHVFGNPILGSMSLQCFINGSLAREKVKDHFDYDWDAFTAAIESTPAGNNGNLMLPFFSPEISPRLDIEAPILEGSDTFKSWGDAAGSIRACVEGQFLNMKRQTAWMQLQPEVIYLTGGASKNDAIAQVIADIFQTKVKRLQVSGSVALGGAMRAAVTTLNASLDKLESLFCAPDAKSTLSPHEAVRPAYKKAESEFGQLVEKL